MDNLNNTLKVIETEKKSFFAEIPNHKIYGVKDEKMGFNEIFVGANDMAVIRQFQSICNDEKSPLAKFPADYSLYYLGELNPETNLITPKPHKLAQATDFTKGK